MESISPLLEWLQEGASGLQSWGSWPIALVLLVAGTALSVLGAKMAKYALAIVFAGLGVMIGAFVGNTVGGPPAVPALLGGAMLGTVAWLTFRLWVGLAASIFLASVALGAFGYERAVPLVPAFNQSLAASALEAAAEPSVPTLGGQQQYRDRTPWDWLQEFGSHVEKNDEKFMPTAGALWAGAMIVGMFLGVLAVRWTLILTTSVLGTLMVTSAVTRLLSESNIPLADAAQKHGLIITICGGVFLLTSLVVQTLITRQAPVVRKPEPAKAP